MADSAASVSRHAVATEKYANNSSNIFIHYQFTKTTSTNLNNLLHVFYFAIVEMTERNN